MVLFVKEKETSVIAMDTWGHTNRLLFGEHGVRLNSDNSFSKIIESRLIIKNLIKKFKIVLELYY